MSDPFEEVADGVFAYHHDWADGLCAIVLGEDTAVAIDGGGDRADGEAMAAFLRRQGREPSRLIYTHGHSDHVCGAAPLGHGEVFSHERTPDVMRAQVSSWAKKWAVSESEAAKRVPWPTATFSDQMMWHLGGRTIQSIRTPGNSIDGTSYLVEDAKVIVAGDAIATGILPALNDGDGRTLEMSHRLLLEMDDQIEALIPGHGPVVRGEAVSETLIWGAGYLRNVRERLRQQLMAGKNDEQTLLDACPYEEFVAGRFDPAVHHMIHRHTAAVTKMIAEERTRIPPQA
ncbi:MAG: MBL fold metallo-hydrolase [Candidatus Latescibacterota bacterium]|nr:MBL fold metallo-hydrolase [Candidatus Latescibacterota bacterium]